MGKAGVFEKYSDWYDTLYATKDYAAESRYVLARLDELAEAGPILELGCGTGRHAREFAEAGRNVVAVDRSEGMLDYAARSVGHTPESSQAQIQFVCSAAQTLDLKRQFAAVVSLFHVVSYQVTQEALTAFFASAHKHLVAGGIFLFDFWYGPAVLFQRPETRSKKVKGVDVEVHRISVPELDPAASVVHVNFDTYVIRGGRDAIEHIVERHSMRYFFETELRQLASQCGFVVVRFEEWMTGRPPGTDTWGVTCILRRA